MIFWRSDTGFRLGKSDTVLDVVRYETEELGNDIGFCEGNAGLCARLRWDACVWVTLTKEAAEHYGDPEKVVIDNPLIIGYDGDDGYLILRGVAR